MRFRPWAFFCFPLGYVYRRARSAAYQRNNLRLLDPGGRPLTQPPERFRGISPGYCKDELLPPRDGGKPARACPAGIRAKPAPEHGWAETL